MEPHQAYQKHFKAVYRFFYYRDVDADDIEDLCQESFFRFFRGYDSTALTEVQSAKVLYVIARNVWREWLRRQPVENTIELEDDMAYAATVEAFSDQLTERMGDEEALERLKEAIKALNPTLRTVISLRFLENKTRKEIAGALGTEEKYVHIYQQRGIKALQKALGSETVSPRAHT